MTFLLPPRFTWKREIFKIILNVCRKKLKPTKNRYLTLKSLSFLSLTIRDLSENLKMVSGNEYVMHFSLIHLHTYLTYFTDFSSINSWINVYILILSNFWCFSRSVVSSTFKNGKCLQKIENNAGELGPTRMKSECTFYIKVYKW